MQELGSVVTEESKHQNKDSLSKMFKKWYTEDDDFLLEESVIKYYKRTECFKLINTAPKHKALILVDL